MSTTAKLDYLNFTNSKTYGLATLFIIGNILFPQLAHLIPNGGFIFLPIYFFTLIAAYKYGFAVGILTAILSPLTNYALFGMPPIAVLPAIMIKSAILAISACLAANYFKRVSLLAVFMAVIAYQIVGTLLEWALIQDLYVALQDVRIGLSGILLQVVGGFFLLKSLERV